MSCARNAGDWTKTFHAEAASVEIDSLGEPPRSHQDDGQAALNVMNSMGLPSDMNVLKLPGYPHLAAQEILGAPIQPEPYKDNNDGKNRERICASRKDTQRGYSFPDDGISRAPWLQL
jgi:hypothetical protein